MGQTRVLAVVKGEITQPYPDRGNEGSLSIFTEFSPMGDPAFEIGRPSDMAVELGRIIDRGLRYQHQNPLATLYDHMFIASQFLRSSEMLRLRRL